MSDLAVALAALYARVPLGMRLGLDPMKGACVRVGHPERAFDVVHVAGTNGKGSVCAMVEASLRAQGIKTGMYTSPHLCRFAERIRIDGAPIEDAALAELLGEVLAAAPELSFFETATLAAFAAFRASGVRVAIVEVGLGGRLDATNVVPPPRASAITRIAFDHMDRLGSTLVEIAREKAGIAKPGMDIVLGPLSAEVRAAIDDTVRAAGAATTIAPSYDGEVGMAGDHQRANAGIAGLLAARCGAGPEAIAAGIVAARWPGRMERIGQFLLDAAHNPDGAAALARHIHALGERPAVLVFGALADKEWPAMLDELAPLADRRVYVVPPIATAARSGLDPAHLAARHAGEIAPDVASALDRARAIGGGLSVVAGSIYLVGEARAALLGLPRDPPVAL